VFSEVNNGVLYRNIPLPRRADFYSPELKYKTQLPLEKMVSGVGAHLILAPLSFCNSLIVEDSIEHLLSFNFPLGYLHNNVFTDFSIKYTISHGYDNNLIL
jgi:hypothetical protein